MSARRELLDMVHGPKPFEHAESEILPLQLAAARELFAERREQIRVLRRRADEAGVEKIRGFQDIVPLLFPHTVYKSYPAAFVENGRWDRMLQWLGTLSVQDPTDVDVEGVADVDDWIDRLRAAGHMVLATSGTSGKCSFLNHTVGDGMAKRRHVSVISGWPQLRSRPDRPVFMLGPSRGPNSAIEALQNNAANWGRPGDIHFLTDEPLRMADVARTAQLRQRMAEGIAAPGEIAAFESETKDKAERMARAVEAIVDKILAHRYEPIVISALWAQHLMIIARARVLGIPDGDFHPESLVNAGGGIKGVALPPDYKAQVDRFYGKVVRGTGYGMTEMAQIFPRCDAFRYHRPPGLVMLPLDRPGERLVEGAEGVVEARFAFLDLLYEGRWGGLISGDRVEVDFSERCPCGRPGPTILDTITRWTQPGEDDHIGCAGTIDGYIRGALSA